MQMATRPLITLLSDFGDRDVYVGTLKGVISGICPAAHLIDLTHHIPPQDRYAARFNLLTACPHFPAATVHLAVVDPGVGTGRRAVAVATAVGHLVGPDNGIFSGLLAHYPATAAVCLDNPAYWRRPQPSATFHGRDLFAPAAAHLAAGVALEQLGTALSPAKLVTLSLPPLEVGANSITGTIQYIDHFGNAVTTVPADRLPVAALQASPNRVRITVQNRQVPLAPTYGAVPPGAPLALVASHGWLEVALRDGNAQAQLGLTVGQRVTVVW